MLESLSLDLGPKLYFEDGKHKITESESLRR